MKCNLMVSKFKQTAAYNTFPILKRRLKWRNVVDNQTKRSDMYVSSPLCLK